MAFELPQLPYPKDALSPQISTETIDYHYGKHHQTYVNKLNGLTQGTPWAEKSLEDIIKTAEGGIFNNGAQVWNHTFYWNSMSPTGGGEPPETVKQALEKNFGSVEDFKEKFTQTAVTTFGSGWAWLVQNKDNSLEVVSSSNASNPLRDEKKPLLTCDVWEHAYYIDYRNARPEYLKVFWSVINWDWVNNNLN